MRRYIKISALASIAIIGVWALVVHFERKHACDTVTVTGWISPDTFFSNRDCLVKSTAPKKRVVVTDSTGGNWESALALGVLIHRHGWDVEIEGLCASACAIFIFPAGKVKYLRSDSLLIFHGGPHQANLRAQFEAADKAKATGSSAVEMNITREGMEGHGSYDPEGAPARRRVREFLSIKDAPTEVGVMLQLTEESDRLYADLGVNLLLPTYGQIGRYEPIYKSYKYGGFMYPLDSLRRLGLHNIEVMGGEWHPERHLEYPYVYEVTYP